MLSFGNGAEVIVGSLHDGLIGENFETGDVEPDAILASSLFVEAGVNDCLDTPVEVERDGFDDSYEAGNLVNDFEAEEGEVSFDVHC